MITLPLAADGAAPGREELLLALDALLGGHMSREEVAAWARMRRDAPPERGQFGAMPRGPLLASAFRALLVADVTEGAWQPRGAPYFIREADLREYAASLRDADAPSRSAWQPPWDGAMPLCAGGVMWSPAAASARLGAETLRGLDDLDYYEMLPFIDAHGRPVELEWRPNGPHPAEANIILPHGGDGWQRDLGDLLSLLGLAEGDVTWRTDARTWEER